MPIITIYLSFSFLFLAFPTGAQNDKQSGGRKMSHSDERASMSAIHEIRRATPADQCLELDYAKFKISGTSIVLNKNGEEEITAIPSSNGW